MDFDYKPEAKLINHLKKDLKLSDKTQIIHQPTMFGDWRFSVIADYLCEELSIEKVWRLNKDVFKDGYFSIVSDLDTSDVNFAVREWGMPSSNSVLIFCNFSDHDVTKVNLWLEIGKKFREEGIKPKIITQLPPYKIDIRFRSFFDIYILYDDKIMSLKEINWYEITDESRVKDLIIIVSATECLSYNNLAVFRQRIGQYFLREYPLYLEYLLLTNEDIDFSNESGLIRVQANKKEEYLRKFKRIDSQLKASMLGFFLTNEILFNKDL